MVHSVAQTVHGSASSRPAVPLLETRRADLVMLCESRLRWAGIHFCIDCLGEAEAAPPKPGPIRVCVHADRLEEARRLLASMDDEIL